MGKLVQGLEVFAVGLLMVFLVLVLIIISIELLHKVMSLKSNKKKETKEIPVNETKEEKDNGALVAAITAAIYQILSSEGKEIGHPEFVIKKIREIKR